MSVLYIALPIALLLGATALVACIGCIRAGQYEDLEAPAYRMLIDEVPRSTVVERASDAKDA